jgi:ATP-dependent RNA helicase DDX54/DBP10
LDAGGILDLDSDDGDEAFIAAQQAASNRKASNLKGKSVKKGGGFQAMGMFSFCRYRGAEN